MYTNQQYDKESGLYYYNARYYDPHLGSFITPDPAMANLNHYAYCSANPIKYSDPTGLTETDPNKNDDEDDETTEDEEDKTWREKVDDWFEEHHGYRPFEIIGEVGLNAYNSMSGDNRRTASGIISAAKNNGGDKSPGVGGANDDLQFGEDPNNPWKFRLAGVNQDKEGNPKILFKYQDQYKNNYNIYAYKINTKDTLTLYTIVEVQRFIFTYERLMPITVDAKTGFALNYISHGYIDTAFGRKPIESARLYDDGYIQYATKDGWCVGATVTGEVTGLHRLGVIIDNSEPWIPGPLDHLKGLFKTFF